MGTVHTLRRVYTYGYMENMMYGTGAGTVT